MQNSMCRAKYTECNLHGAECNVQREMCRVQSTEFNVQSNVQTHLNYAFQFLWKNLQTFLVPQKQMSFDLSPTITRKELPSCEAIDVRKVNIGSIVRPVTKFKAGKNLKGQTEFKAGSAY